MCKYIKNVTIMNSVQSHILHLEKSTITMTNIAKGQISLYIGYITSTLRMETQSLIMYYHNSQGALSQRI